LNSYEIFTFIIDMVELATCSHSVSLSSSILSRTITRIIYLWSLL